MKTLARGLVFVILVSCATDDQAQLEAPLTAAPGLIVWPYVGHVTPTTAHIAWATKAAGSSEVRYGSGATLDQSVAATDQTLDWRYFHSTALTGLAPGTTYTYKIYTAGTDLLAGTLTFKTAPDPTTTHSFTFGAMGDGRGGGSGATQVAGQLLSKTFDFVIHSGDFIVDTGCAGASSASTTSTVADFIGQFFTIHKNWLVRTPFYGVMGNHEMGSCGPEFFTKMFSLPQNGGGERYYSFDWANAHIVGVDVTQAYGSGSTQFQWLEKDLTANTKPWTFVFFHYPPFSSGNHGSDATAKSALVPLFERTGVDLVFNGHDHTYERTCSILGGACSTSGQGVTYAVTGGMGAPLYNASGGWFTAARASRYHYMTLEVQDDCHLQGTATDGSGVTFDSFQVNRSGCTTTSTASAPSVPTGLSATARDGAVALAWSPNAESVTGYNVKRSTSAGDANPTVLSSALPSTSFTDLAVTNGTTYYYVVSAVNAGLESAHSAEVSATPAAQVPTITTQPTARTVSVGQTATFTVGVAGSTPLSYQWRKNGAALTGATGASYTTPATTLADSGAAFDVIVTNAVGTATSSSALLTVTSFMTTNLVLNGDFEAGTSPWQSTAGVIGSFKEQPAYEGTRCGWLGGLGYTATEVLYQQVTIPATATNATLSFYLHIDSAETSTTTALDKLTVYLLTTTGTVLRNLGSVSNLSRATGYKLYSIDVTDQKGKTLLVYFKSSEDSARQTSFVVDKVALVTK